MKTRIISISALILVLGISLVSIYNVEKQAERVEAFEETNEERPDQELLMPEEKLLFEKYLLSQEDDAVKLKSGVLSEVGSYADGALTGVWNSKIMHTGWYGYRVDNSVYDPIHDRFYVVSYAGHLYKLDATGTPKWTRLNHKIVLNPPNNGTANSMLYGFNLPDSTFRLIRSYDEKTRVEYSDDEGVTWIRANVPSVSRSWANNGFLLDQDTIKKVVMMCDNNGYYTTYISADYGKSFTGKTPTFRNTIYNVRLVNPYNSSEAFVVAWSTKSGKVFLYRYNVMSDALELENISSGVVPGSSLSSVDATLVNGTYHFYMSTNNGDQTVYYSSDLGVNWVQKNSGRDKPFECVHPTKPNTLFSGFEDLNYSSDGGVNWTGTSHKLGWDLQHMKMHRKANGRYVAFLGFDFGCYISETPDDKESYKWLNDGASFGMHYDAVSSEKLNSIYMANQDRGTTACEDTGSDVNTIDIDGTDVFRVAYANNDMSVWSWFYYGRIKHRYNFPTKKKGEAVYDGLGNWWAAPIIASPDPTEDAIYAAYGASLQKFEFVEASGSIVKTSHPFDFMVAFGSDLGGFGYSSLNRKLWYASLLDGSFLYSRDGGDTWRETSYSGTLPIANDQGYNYNKNQAVIKTSLKDTMTVFYAGVKKVFLISKDGGKTFSNHVNGLDIYRIRDFDISNDEKFIFAACGYGGAWVYSVDADKWFAMDDAAVPYVDFTDVQFIRRKNIVRFATFGSGIIDFKLDGMDPVIKAPEKLITSVINGQQIDLSWIDNSDNEIGFIIERAEKDGFVAIDTVDSNVISFSDTTVNYSSNYFYQVKAYTVTDISFSSNMAYAATIAKGIIPSSGWRIIYVDSEETVGEYSPAKYAIDNNPSTYWHTQWKGSQPAYPHELQVDMGNSTPVVGFIYLPRQDGSIIGSIDNYQFYVSNDSVNWGNPVASGRFSTDNLAKEIMLDIPTEGRFFKLVARSEISGGVYASAAEIMLLYQALAPNPPSDLSVVSNTFSSIWLSWKDNSNNESGFIIEQLINGTFVTIDSLRAGKRAVEVTGLIGSTEYSFRVSSYSDAGPSMPTDVATTTTKVNPNGVNENEVDVNLYPNPVVSVLNLDFPLNTIQKIQVVNMKGDVVYRKSISSASAGEVLDLSKLPNGIYFVRLLGDGSTIVRKIIKE